MQFVAKWKKSRYRCVSEDKRSPTDSPTEGFKATDHCTSSSCEICFLIVQHASVFLVSWDFYLWFADGFFVDLWFLFFVHSSLLLLSAHFTSKQKLSDNMFQLIKIIGSSTDNLIITNYANVFTFLVHKMCRRINILLFDTELAAPEKLRNMSNLRI